MVREPVEQLVGLELRRLDALLRGMYKRAVAGNLFALDRALKIQERRAKSLGLDK